MAARVGIDTGGTFTDIVRLDEGRITVHKVRTTPDDPSAGILDGLAGAAASNVSDIIHGSTVATNAVLERKGAKVALVTTLGFEDVLRIGRQTRPELYNFFVRPRPPLVDPALTFGLDERLDADGRVVEPVEPDDLERVARALQAASPDIVAICLLHAYANAEHERAVVERIRALGFRACASHEVLPEYREYERWSTTVLNAYVTPVVDRYLGRLAERLPRVRLRIMQSNGGCISAAAARAQAVRTVLSGPAAGVVGARAVARAAGIDRLISFDMGGTSTDVALVDGTIPMTVESVVGDFPLRLPVTDLQTVGAGGGSIARVDAGGALRVGPESAGASPGPACYGVGEEFTVTDAHLLLGRLDPAAFLGGRMTLDAARARAAAARLAARLGMTIEQVAEGVLRVANATMERAIRIVSLERGHDPRAFALVAFGGAGGMHAADIAAGLGIGSVLVPRHAGVLSALGMLMADVTRDYSASVLEPADRMPIAELARRTRPLIRQAIRDLTREGFPRGRHRLRQWLDVRYVGQSYEISVPMSARYRSEFDRAHRRLYGYADPARPVEVTAVRVRAEGITDKPSLAFQRSFRKATPERRVIRPAWFSGRRVRAGFYDWRDLRPGHAARGPAVITGAEASIVVPPRARFGVDGYGNVRIAAATRS